MDWKTISLTNKMEGERRLPKHQKLHYNKAVLHKEKPEFKHSHIDIARRRKLRVHCGKKNKTHTQGQIGTP